MSTYDENIKSFNHQEMMERIYLFKEKIKSSFGEDRVPKALSSANIHNYRLRQNIPKGDVLEDLGAKFGLNINWLLWGEGEMFRTEQTIPSVDMETLVAMDRENRELLRENRQLRIELDELRKAAAQENFTTVPAHGTSNAVPSSRQETE